MRYFQWGRGIMSKVANIVDELKRIHEGEAWHGQSLRELLAGVTAQVAASRPVADAHSIWEIVLHIAGWEDVVCRRLDGIQADAPTEGDFPPVDETSEEGWRQTLAKLQSIHERLIKKVSELPDEALPGKVVGADYSVGFLLRGTIRHHVYHAGQIGLLKKASSSPREA
jgi:uncharacterized damage-inducible protein DinB